MNRFIENTDGKDQFFISESFSFKKLKENIDIEKFLQILISMFQNLTMTDPILYLSMLLGLGGIYVLISSFNDDDGDDDGEKYFYNFENTNLAG